MSPNTSLRGSIAAGFDLDEIQDSWGWFMALGIALVVLGLVCIAAEVTATLVTVLTFGWLLILGAVVALIQAFRVRKWSGFSLYFLSALLRGVTGYLLIRYPFTAEAALTLILASFFIVAGIFRMVGAGTLRFPRWAWAVLSGLIAVALGVTLLVLLPAVSLWFIGVAIGVEFIFDGVSVITLGSALRGVPSGGSLAKA
jgi:uncharacterized membrane protein HdeD (DUF308 family)